MASTNQTSEEEFLAKCEEEFKHRYTENDEEFMKVFNTKPCTPPIVENWWVPNARRNDRRNRRNPYERPQHNRDGNRGQHRGNQREDYRSNRRDYGGSRESNYSRY